MSVVVGEWDITVRTPIGAIEATYRFHATDHGVNGTATGAGETIELQDVTVEPVATGEHVTWRQSIAKPLRLNLAFDVIIERDRLYGHSRAGRLPPSTVTGTRTRG